MTAIDDRLTALRRAGRTGPAEGISLGHVALAKTEAAPDHLILDGRHRMTRGEMTDAACRLGGALAARGIGKGAVVGFQLPNWWEACVIGLAAALFGYRLVPLLTIYRAAELGQILPACAVDVLFVPETYRGTDYPALINALPQPPRHVVTVRGGRDDERSFERMLAHAPARPSPAPADDAKLIIFTSGSTGRPKGVIHSHATMDALIRLAADFWPITADDTLYVPSPIGHVGGLIYAFEFPWLTDCRVVLAEHWDADAAVGEIEAHGATFMAGATPFLSGLLEAAERAGTALPSLRRFICGGASVPPELVRRALAAFPNAVVSRAYGSTEVSLVCPGIRDRAEAEARADTDGECVVEMRLIDDLGRPVPPDEPGEIVVRGPQMFLGYLDPADEADCFTPDGFFRMGDLGRRVDGRYLEITGRKKDIIIRKGENISPLEIENALGRHPAVRKSAVVGTPDAVRGEMVVAFVVPEGRRSFTLAEMTAHLTALGLARQKFPERLEIVPALPENAVGKVQKPVLRKWAMGEMEAVVEPGP